MASTSSSVAVATMAQRVSDKYLECRRNVSAKIDEVKQLDEKISAVFQQITALSEASDGQEVSEEAKASAKSVGRLEVSLVGVEGNEPVPNATITVSLDPEYEADEYETVEEVVEKKDVVVTDEHGHVIEDGQLPSEDEENSPRKLKTTTKITRTIIKKRVKKEKVPVVRTVAWTAGATADDGETLTFPATFVFDPVQSREATVIITVAAAENDDNETDPVKEVEFPISSLFHDNELDKWYSIADDGEAEEPTTIVEIVEKPEENVKVEIASSETKETRQDKEIENEEGEVNEADKAEKTEKETVEVAAAMDISTCEVEQTEVAQTVQEAEHVEMTAVVEETKPAASRFHVKAKFVLSEAEKLSISAVELSRKKQEAEAALQVVEQEAASLRTEYNRLNASQRKLNASGISKPKSKLLAGRFGASVPVQPKSWYQLSRERANAFLIKHQQILISVGMFAGSVCLFHLKGENLLA